MYAISLRSLTFIFEAAERLGKRKAVGDLEGLADDQTDQKPIDHLRAALLLTMLDDLQGHLRGARICDEHHSDAHVS